MNALPYYEKSFGVRTCRRLTIEMLEGGIPFTGGVGYTVIDTLTGWRGALCTGYVRGGAFSVTVPIGRASALLLAASSGAKSATGPLLQAQGDETVDIDLDSSAGEVSGEPAEISGSISLRAPDGAVGPVARGVVAVQQFGGAWRVVGTARSAEADGSYTLSGLVDPGADVFLMALDDLGAVFEPELEVAGDDLIHPTTPNGYVYRVVTGGELPATEPDWWTTGQQQVGTATLEAREYLRPLAHGPVDVTFL